MSKIAIDTIEDLSASESVDATYVVHGTAKALLRYDQSTPLIDDSMGISSVTDSATGVFIPIFSTAFANANYMIAATNRSNRSAGYITPTTAQVQSETRNAGTTTLSDNTDNTAAWFGDLA